MPKRKIKNITGRTIREKVKIRRRQRWQNETEQEAAARKLVDAERARLRRMNETEQEAAARRWAEAERARARRKHETEQAAAARRLAVAERARVRRKNETEEEAAARRLADAERARVRRMNETEQEAAARRLAAAEKTRLRRMNETEQEAAARRLADAERARVRRMNETEQEAAARRLAAAEKARLRRMNETEQKAAARRLADAERARKRRMNETKQAATVQSLTDAERMVMGQMEHHFNFDQYKWSRKDGLKRLREFAVPTLFGDITPMIISPHIKSSLIAQSFIKNQERRIVKKLLPKPTQNIENKCFHFSDSFINETLGMLKSAKNHQVGESTDIGETLSAELHGNADMLNLYTMKYVSSLTEPTQHVPIEVQCFDHMPTREEINRTFSISQPAEKSESETLVINYKDVVEQEASALHSRIELLNVENEMFKKKLKYLGKQEDAITAENESLQVEVLLLKKHNRGMNTVLMELQKHNDALSKRVVDLQNETTVLFEQISDFQEKHSDLLSKMMLSDYEKQLIDKIKTIQTIATTESNA